MDAKEPPAPYPTSFEQIVELISTGQPIPGIKEVPDTVLEGQASETKVGRRRKPWETGERENGDRDDETTAVGEEGENRLGETILSA